MGTPTFALPILETLAAATECVGVASQPDKPQGRGLAPAPSPIARAALARGIPVLRPVKLGDPQAAATLAAWRPDLIVVAAYGKLLPAALLALPTLAPINVHASLLPRHRGAAPIAAAILAGDTTTGITIMLMNEAMDEGDILLQRSLSIAADDTTETLTARLAALGGTALAEALVELRGPGLAPRAQDATLATYTPRLSKDDGRIRWHEPAALIERKVRAFTPWPATFTRLAGRTVKILTARVAPEASATHARSEHRAAAEPAHPAPGTVVGLGDGIRVATGAGTIELLSLQMEGRRPLAARAFVAGARLAVGARFDD
jgi:methionyl-tRNA formyltransferase